MKKINRIKKIYTVLAIFFAISAINYLYLIKISQVNYGEYFDPQSKQNLKLGTEWVVNVEIHIDESLGGVNSWAYYASTYAWCNGLGTLSEPYIIENVTSTNPVYVGFHHDFNYGFVINNSRAYFIIKNCIVDSSGSSSDMSGFLLKNTTNGKVINCMVTDDSEDVYNKYGINLINSSNNLISGNNIFEKWYGIGLLNSSENEISENSINSTYAEGMMLDYSHHNIISENNFSNLYEVRIENSNNNLIEGNILLNAHFVLWECNNLTISENIIDENDDFGFFIRLTNNSIISRNIIKNGADGMYMVFCHNNTISENDIYNLNEHEYGIIIASCNNITISDNKLFNIWVGISVQVSSTNNIVSENLITNSEGTGIKISYDCKHNIVSKNNLSENLQGITLNGQNNTITGNLIVNNNFMGITTDFTYTEDNLIYNNSFIGNLDHTRDDGTNNQWDNGSLGNYWDDYEGVDADRDGIGDTPYDVPPVGGSQDNYPIKPIDTENPIIINPPTDFNVEYGYTGVSIPWIATDTNPNTYTIELQGTGIVAGPTAYSSGTAVNYGVPDGLSIGSYIYTVNFTDDYDNYITDSVNMTVVDDTSDAVITDSPLDFNVELGYTGISIPWTATDTNPNTYTIELQGTGIVAGPTAWSSGIAITYNVPDGLSVGSYIYTVNFTDDYNHYITDSVTMTVEDTTDPVITVAPIDFSIGYDYTGVNISWTAIDLNPNTYIITLQGSGIVAGPTAWSSGIAITYDVPDGLGIGSYIYTVNITDDYDNFITDSVTMTVEDTTDPVITVAPSDFNVEFGYTGESISWTATDFSPNTYTIELLGSGIVVGPTAWSSGITIIYDVPNGFGIGSYIYIVNFTDDYGNLAIHNVTMTVQDTTDPIITDAPSDFSIKFGYSGVNISWTATDPHPQTYTIELQGSGIIVDPTAWLSGIAITYDVPEGLAVGNYTYTINITDAHGNFITHTVIMTVEEVIIGDGAIPLELIVIISVIGGVAVIGVAGILVLRRRRAK